MGFFNFFINLTRVFVLYFLFDFFQDENYFQFSILLLSVFFDIVANFNIMIVFFFIIFSVLASLDIIMSRMIKSIIIIIYNILLIWNYSCHASFNYKMERKKSMQRYLENLENCSDESVECFICLENCKERSNLKILSCSHFYHTECILEWFHKNKSKVCPVCKQEVIKMDKIIIV